MLVGAPQVDVAKAEGVPPGVEHGTVETEDALASDASRGRSKRGETIIDAGAIGVTDAGEQMPEGESVALAGFREDDGEEGGAFRGRSGRKIKFCQGITKRSGCFV